MRTPGVLIMAAAFTAACGTGPANPDWRVEEPTVAMQGMMIHVENHRASPMRIFVVRGGAQMYLGDIGGNERGSFFIPPVAMAGAGPLRLLADPSGSTLTAESKPIDLTNGRHIEWQIRKGGDRVWVK